MSKYAILNTASRAVHKAGFMFKKHSPEILVVAGVVGTVVSTVMACKATTKAQPIIEDDKTQIADLNDRIEDEEIVLDEKEYKKEVAIIHTKTAVEVFKVYAPAVGVGLVSVTAILAGTNIFRKRNVALAAAYTAIDNSFKEYRGRVIERFGEELDRELKYNIKKKEIEEVVANEDGSEQVIKKTVDVIDTPFDYSEYAKCFDNGCKGWTKDPELNMLTLRQVQNYANDRLKAKGWLLLNEVYDMLGIPRTKAGMVVGWIYDEKHPVGDNYVDFGIFNIHVPANRDFVNGYERTIWLDFNVDGNIYEMM